MNHMFSRPQVLALWTAGLLGLGLIGVASATNSGPSLNATTSFFEAPSGSFTNENGFVLPQAKLEQHADHSKDAEPTQTENTEAAVSLSEQDEELAGATAQSSDSRAKTTETRHVDVEVRGDNASVDARDGGISVDVKHTSTVDDSKNKTKVDIDADRSVQVDRDEDVDNDIDEDIDAGNDSIKGNENVGKYSPGTTKIDLGL